MQPAPPPADRLGTPVVLLRAFLLAAVILACASFSHVIADGLLPSAASMGWLLLATTFAVRYFLHRPAGRLLLLTLIVGGQAVLHVFLSAMAGHGVSQVAGSTAALAGASTGGSPGEQYAARQEALIAASGYSALNPSDLLAHQWEHLADTGPLMVFSHTGAAAVVALWLASGERSLAALIALSSDRVADAAPRLLPDFYAATAPLLTAPLRLTATVRRSAAAREARPHEAFVRRVVSHRGPPAVWPAPRHLSLPR